MNRTEFLEQLERLLWDIPESERKAALEYYQDYFEDAGAENEGKVIQELGSPGKVAAIIRADLENEGIQYGEYTETGYTDERFQEKNVPEPSEMKENSEKSETGSGTGQEENNWDGTRYRDPQGERRQHSYDGDGPYSRAGYGRAYGQNPRRSRSGAGWILLIIFVIVAFPMVFGFGMGALGILMGLSHGVWFRNGSFRYTYGDHRRHYRTAGRRDRPDCRRRYVSDPHPGVSAAFSSYSSCLCGRGAHDDGSWYPAAPGFHLAGLPGVPGSIPLDGGSDPESPAQRYPGR